LVFEFKLPDLGEGVAEGEIVKWLVTEGQEIKEDQPMVEVMTDKATVQIPSPATGRIKQIVTKAGQTVKVGSTVVVLDTGEDNGTGEKRTGQQSAASKEATAEPQRVIQRPAEAGASSQKIVTGQVPRTVIATPATRKLARELGVEIDLLQGSGPGGRVTEDDVRQASKSGMQFAKPEAAPKQQGEVAYEPAAARPRPVSLAQKQAPQEMREERVAIHGIRKRTMEKMSKSVRTAAHVWHVDEVDYTELVKLRQSAKTIAESLNIKLTYMPFIIKAIVHALKEFPYFNASIDDERQEIVVKHYYNIGFATDTPNGLVVPVIKEPNRKSILEIAREMEQLADDARKGSITLENIQGGTFTVTNIGGLGGVFAMPIINHPEVAILGVLKIEKRPVVKDGQIVARDVGYISLGFDHRIVDGADAARFTTKIVNYLENPSSLLLDSL
jgi:pyruvate/2-oxoglutarate dehydrogenase complex dihydrolipoamide acyltransferase (E2) component